MALDGKSSQEYPVNVEVPEDPIHGPTLFLLYIIGFHDVICNNVIYADDIGLSTLSVTSHLICGNN